MAPIICFLNDLGFAKTIKDINAGLHKYLAHYCISSYAVTCYTRHVKSAQKLSYQMASPQLRAWHEHYLEQGYADVDRTLEVVHQFTLPSYWDINQQLSVAKNNREKIMRQESLEFGIGSGLSLPLHTAGSDFAVLVLHQRQGETCLAHYQQMQCEWLSAGIYFYHYLRKFLNIEEPRTQTVNLTKREKKCLELTAKDCRVETIAETLDISIRTVNFHLQNANKKLGTNNKYQSVNRYYDGAQ